MTSNLPVCSSSTWDSASHLLFHPPQHDSGSWKAFETNQNTSDNSNSDNFVGSSNRFDHSTDSRISATDIPTTYTLGPIDGNLYATISKPNKLSVDQSTNLHNQRAPLTSFGQKLPQPDSSQSMNVNYNESSPQSNFDPGISSDPRPMRAVSTFLSSQPNLANDKLSTRVTNETNNNTVMPNGYKSGSIVNVEAIVHHRPQAAVDLEYYSVSPSSNYSNGEPTANYPAPRTGISEAEQAALDELLSGMLREVENFPDYPVASVVSREAKDLNRNEPLQRPDSLSSDVDSSDPQPDRPVRVSSPQMPTLTDHFGKIEPLPVRLLTKALPTSPADELSRPYHARPGSQPFSYGVTKSSPALQRRRVVSESTAYVCESLPKPNQQAAEPNRISPLPSTEPSSPIPVAKMLEPIESFTPEPMIASTANNSRDYNYSVEETCISIEEPSFTSDNGQYESQSHYHKSDEVDTSGLTWLQKQQLKLKSRHEDAGQRSKDLVLAELRGTISRNEFNHGPPDSRSSSPSMSRSPLTLPRLSDSPLPTESAQARDIANSPSSPPPVPAVAYSSPKTPNADSSEKSQSVSTTQASPEYSRPFHVNIFDSRNSSNVHSNFESPGTPSMYSGSKSLLNPLARQNSIPSAPSHYRYLSNSGSASPLTYSQIRDSYSRTLSSPEPGCDSPSVYFGQSQRSSLLSLNESEIISQHPTFIKDTSKFWYKPTIPREDAIKLLLDKPPGSFIIRDSNSFPGAFGLAIKVAQPPPDVRTKSGGISNELVRHFLIEPTSKGVRIKGCPNEPVFASLSALVYQHSITPLALSCKLIIPENDLTLKGSISSSMLNSPGITGTLSSLSFISETSEILAQGAACNVLYLMTIETESLTGPLAIRNAVTELLSRSAPPNETIVHFKVSNSGITMTDNSHKHFFRRHYPLTTVSHFGLDPEGRCYKAKASNTRISSLFGFVARTRGTAKPNTNNECHLFVEFDEDQAASAIVSFANKVILSLTRDERSKQLL